MIHKTTPIQIGSLIKTAIGVFGVVSKFNHQDNLYTISWASGMRSGENISYEKKMIDHLVAEGDWSHFSPTGEL